MNDFYVYAWRRPDTGEVFYVGKGYGKRAGELKRHNPIFMRIVAKLKRMNMVPTIEFVGAGLTEKEAFDLECTEISRYGRRDMGTGSLVNLTEGGDGIRGAIRTPEHNAKIGASKIGKPRSEDTKAKLSAARRGVGISESHRLAISRGLMKRQPPSAETREKIGSAHRGKEISRDIRDKISRTMTGRRLPTAHVENMSAAVKLRFQDSAERIKTAVSVRMARPYRSNTSGFKGVSFRKDRGVWRANIKTGGRPVLLGHFSTAEEAARAYDRAAFEAWGLDCYLNFGPPAANDNKDAQLCRQEN